MGAKDSGDQIERGQGCPVCGSEGTRALAPAGRSDFRYLVCAGCGTGRIDPLPERPEELYTRDYFVEGGRIAGYVDYEADRRWHRSTARTRLRRVEAALGTNHEARSLVDVGAATGFFLDVAREAGWQAAGVEASDWAAERARAKGHRMEPSLAGYGPEAQFDAVTFFQVLEHFPDPAMALRLAAQRLQPGGVVVCETWDARSRTARLTGSRWQQLSPPSVLWLFTRDGMRRMAADAGLELVGWGRSPKFISLATVVGQSVPATSQGIPARVLRAVGSTVAVPYPLDDLVTAVLRRPTPSVAHGL